jgi:hypothetical protein
MANIFSKIIKKVVPQQERRCPVCKRTLRQALEEQLNEQKICPLEYCPFEQEIRQAILESKTPEVILWNVNKTEIFDNEEIILSWEVLYAKKVSISGIGEVPSKGTYSISPHQNTVYTINIQDYKNNIYKTEQLIEIKVTPFPIVQFQSNKIRLEINDSITFNWQTQYTTKIEIISNNRRIDVTDKTDYTTHPESSATYKLIATALDNKTTIEKEINIEVFPKPEIKYFKANPEKASSSMPVILSWKVENANKVEINNGIGEVSAEGQKEDVYREDTLYKITAIGELSTASQNVIVRIFPTPVIESLQVPMPDFESRINLSQIKISSPKIDVSINIQELNLNLPNFNLDTPKFSVPETDLSKIKPQYKSKMSILNFSKIHEYIRQRSENRGKS